jgi:hypothetical protein
LAAMNPEASCMMVAELGSVACAPAAGRAVVVVMGSSLIGRFAIGSRIA